MKPKAHRHRTHPDIGRRLRRANGHLEAIIAMIAAEKPCLELAQQLYAVEKAINQAKKALIQDHLDHCLEDTVGRLARPQRRSVEEFKEITKYL